MSVKHDGKFYARNLPLSREIARNRQTAFEVNNGLATPPNNQDAVGSNDLIAALRLIVRRAKAVFQ